MEKNTMKGTLKLGSVAAATAVALALPATAMATNGMNLEGYGPIATGMGGASMAYDNGTAAVMNNPATLGLMPEGDRIDAALGMLGPDVAAEMDGMPKASSSGDAYYMPALGWARKQGQATYGLALFAQGGMGTDYSENSFLARNTGDEVRSEVSVGRLIAPLAFDVNDQLTLGGSIEYVWAGMDLKMAASSAQLGNMVTGGSLASQLPSLISNFGIQSGRFDFSNNSDYTGEAMGAGFAAKLGAVYKINSDLQVGFTYHSKTSMGDLETDNAELSMYTNAANDPNTAQAVALSGEVKVKDFQWPETYALGAAWQPSERLLIAGDVKQINWSAVMDEFKMSFTADKSDSNNLGGSNDFRGASLDVSMPQEWDDQTVVQLGGAYGITDNFTGRLGLNMASNPIPDKYLNPLFPAIVENHLTFGGGYGFSEAQSVDFSVTYAPEVEAKNSRNMVVSSHSQLNWQVMYSHRF